MTEEKINFSDLIDDYLRRETHPPAIGTYWPSEIGNCLRWNYYKRFIPQAIPPDKLRLFKSADLAHLFIRDVLARSDRVQLLDWEKSFSIVYGDAEISGRLDDLILIRVAGEAHPVVVEVKSVSGKRVSHISAPTLAHLYQVHPYMKAAKAKLALLWYIARDTYADKWFTVFYDKRIMDEALMRVGLLHQFLTEHRLPPAEAKNAKDIQYLCWFCPYYRECQANFNPPANSRSG